MLDRVWDRRVSECQIDIDYTKILAEGIYGRVRLGHMTNAANKPIAFKSIQGYGDDKDEVYEDAINEIQIMGSLDCPYIVSLICFTVKRSHSECWVKIGMAYAEKGSLDENLPWPNFFGLYQLLLELAKAISYMHTQGFLHCDIKPPNLLVTKDDHLLVADLGFARDIKKTYDYSAGSSIYFSPELLSEFGINSAASDIYALSITFCQTLLGVTSRKLCSKYFSYVENADVNDRDEILYRYLSQGERIPIPTTPICTEGMQKLITQGWSHYETKRPTAQEVEKKLEKINSDIRQHFHKFMLFSQVSQQNKLLANPEKRIKQNLILTLRS